MEACRSLQRISALEATGAGAGSLSWSNKNQGEEEERMKRGTSGHYLFWTAVYLFLTWMLLHFHIIS